MTEIGTRLKDFGSILEGWEWAKTSVWMHLAGKTEHIEFLTTSGDIQGDYSQNLSSGTINPKKETLELTEVESCQTPYENTPKGTRPPLRSKSKT